MDQLDRLHIHLRSHNISRTSQRDTIFKAFGQTDPQSIAILAAILKGKMSRATIYNNLKKLQQVDVIEAVGDNQFELTDRFKQHHHYFTCRNCTKRTSFNDEKLEQALERVTTRRKLVLEDHRVELTGLCSQCRNEGVQPRQAIGLDLRRPPD